MKRACIAETVVPMYCSCYMYSTKTSGHRGGGGLSRDDRWARRRRCPRGWCRASYLSSRRTRTWAGWREGCTWGTEGSGRRRAPGRCHGPPWLPAEAPSSPSSPCPGAWGCRRWAPGPRASASGPASARCGQTPLYEACSETELRFIFFTILPPIRDSW